MNRYWIVRTPDHHTIGLSVRSPHAAIEDALAHCGRTTRHHLLLLANFLEGHPLSLDRYELHAFSVAREAFPALLVDGAARYELTPSGADALGAADEAVERCEGSTPEDPCGPVVAADREGVPLCASCAWEIDREVLGNVAKLVGYDREKHDGLEAAVTERLAVMPQSFDIPIVVDAIDDAAGHAVAEVSRAMVKFPTWPTDPLHALAVVGEEFGELTRAVLQRTYEPHKQVDAEDIRVEAMQLAAMALRFYASLPAYVYEGGKQHDQTTATREGRADV